MKKLDKIAKFLEGIASIISLYPQENKHKITLPTSSISTSLTNDWKKVGLDMWQAYRTMESQQLEAKHYRNSNDRFERPPTQRA